MSYMCRTNTVVTDAQIVRLPWLKQRISAWALQNGHILTPEDNDVALALQGTSCIGVIIVKFKGMITEL